MKLTAFIFSVIIIVSCQTKHVENENLQPKLDTIKVIEVEIDSVAEISLSTPELPDFAKYKDVKEKKKAFFDFLRPMIIAENARIREERERIKTIFNDYSKTKSITESDSIWILSLAEAMRMENFDLANIKDRNTLLRKKDIVPITMFMAQAANESSWGTSRFAKEANNLFGQWCYTPGCGIVPSQRQSNDVNEVRKFATINDAVKSYVRNINSYYAYKDLRLIREEIRAKGDQPDGQSLANGLLKYSERGEAYVKEIQAMIRVNKSLMVE